AEREHVHTPILPVDPPTVGPSKSRGHALWAHEGASRNDPSVKPPSRIKKRGAALGPSCPHTAELWSRLVAPHHAGLLRRIALEHEVPSLEPRPSERQRQHFAELLDEMRL